jgi:hypothetical protein
VIDVTALLLTTTVDEVLAVWAVVMRVVPEAGISMRGQMCGMPLPQRLRTRGRRTRARVHREHPLLIPRKHRQRESKDQ